MNTLTQRIHQLQATTTGLLVLALIGAAVSLAVCCFLGALGGVAMALCRGDALPTVQSMIGSGVTIWAWWLFPQLTVCSILIINELLHGYRLRRRLLRPVHHGDAIRCEPLFDC